MTAGRHANPDGERAARDWQPWSLPIGVCATALGLTALLFAATAAAPKVTVAAQTTPPERAEAVRGVPTWSTAAIPSIGAQPVPDYEPVTTAAPTSLRSTATVSRPVITDRPRIATESPLPPSQPEPVPVEVEAPAATQSASQPVVTLPLPTQAAQTSTTTPTATATETSTEPEPTATPTATEAGDLIGELVDDATQTEETP